MVSKDLVSKPLTDEEKKFLDWYQHNYVTKFNANGVPQAPRFPVDFWSIRELIDLDYPKTQGNAEVFHHEVHQLLDAKHVTLYKLISFLKSKMIAIGVSINSANNGQPAPKRKRSKYVRRNAAIRDVLEHQEAFETRIDFLHALAINMSADN